MIGLLITACALSTIEQVPEEQGDSAVVETHSDYEMILQAEEAATVLDTLHTGTSISTVSSHTHFYVDEHYIYTQQEPAVPFRGTQASPLTVYSSIVPRCCAMAP